MTFAPEALGEYVAELLVGATDADVEVQRLDLRGVAASIGLTVEPEGLSFGLVVVKTTKTLLLDVTNDTDVNANVEAIVGTNVSRCGAVGAEDTSFCVLVRDRVVSPDHRFMLAPAETATLEVRFGPPIAGTRERGTFTLRPCRPNVCDVVVHLEGFGVDAGLRSDAAAVDFGRVAAGACLTRTATCSNTANVPVTVLGWGPASGAGLATSSDFSFSSSTGLVMEEGDAFEIDITYCPDGVGDDEGYLAVETDQAQPNRYVLVGLRGSGG